jgi:hypothetical protein
LHAAPPEPPASGLIPGACSGRRRGIHASSAAMDSRPMLPHRRK